MDVLRKQKMRSVMYRIAAANKNTYVLPVLTRMTTSMTEKLNQVDMTDKRTLINISTYKIHIKNLQIIMEILFKLSKIVQGTVTQCFKSLVLI